jgi:acetylornithine deacetylase/succinyl-diaminopimelate desuccinylase-like protein
VNLAERTLELVRIESPTGETRAAAELYADWLCAAGMEVDVQRDAFPATPTVIGRLRGSRPGPRLVLNGHLDTVPIPHDAPRIDGDRVYGRGAADMKGALVSALAAAEALGGDFAGELAIVAIGLHEAPRGRGEDLVHLLRERGFRSDVAIVGELGGDRLPVAHTGCATFEIEVAREGMPTHELMTPAGTPHPLVAAARVVEALAARTAELAAEEHEWVGAETYFLGELHGGDFYNRFPSRCRLVGTRRWAPGRRFADVEEEFRALLAPLADKTGCTIELDLRLVRDAYRIDPEHSLARALRDAYRDVTGTDLPLTGTKVVADAAVWQAEAGIPTIYHGPQGTGAHADVESIEVAELVRATKVYLRLLERLWS